MVTTSSEMARQYWLLILFRGIIALLFGIMALISVEFTLLFLVYFFGAYVLIDGILAIIVSLQERKSTRAWLVVFLIGIVGIVIGVLSFIHPGNVALVIFYLVAAWLIIAGFFGVISALLRASGTEWLSIVGGVLSIIIGIVFLCPVPAILNKRIREKDTPRKGLGRYGREQEETVYTRVQSEGRFGEPATRHHH